MGATGAADLYAHRAVTVRIVINRARCLYAANRLQANLYFTLGAKFIGPRRMQRNPPKPVSPE